MWPRGRDLRTACLRMGTRTSATWCRRPTSCPHPHSTGIPLPLVHHASNALVRYGHAPGTCVRTTPCGRRALLKTGFASRHFVVVAHCTALTLRQRGASVRCPPHQLAGSEEERVGGTSGHELQCEHSNAQTPPKGQGGESSPTFRCHARLTLLQISSHEHYVSYPEHKKQPVAVKTRSFCASFDK